MTARVASILNIKRDEAYRILILFVASFFLGGALLFYYTASNSIFLTAYDAATLPYVYIVNAVFVILFGVLYNRLQKRFALIGLLFSSLVVLIVSIGAFWITLKVTDNRAVIFLMMTWFRLIFIYTTLGLWELASAVFDVRQAKRLFALVSLGVLLAFIIGGLSTPLLTQVIAIDDLLLFSAIFLLCYALILLRLAPALQIAPPTEAETAPFPVREMFKDRYIALIFVLKTVTIINYYIVEFIFYAEAANRYPLEADLANFLGTFIGISTLLMALIAATLTGRYITRFGLQVALLTMPTILLITALVSGSYGLLVTTGNVTFFLLAISIKFSNEVLEKSVHIPALGVLYQPIPRHKRMPVRVAVEGWFGSVALVGSGVLLLLFNLLPDVNITFFIVMSFIMTAGYVAITALVYRQYRVQLRAAVSSRFLSGVALPDETLTPEFLQGELYGDHPAKALTTLQYSHYLEQQPDAPFWLALLDHPAEAVKVDVLQRITAHDASVNSQPIERLVNDAVQPLTVRGQALITLTHLAPKVARPTRFLDTALQPHALTALLRYGDEDGKQQALTLINRCAGSPNIKERARVLSFIDDLPQPEPVLLRLLQDDDAQIRDDAISASAGHLSPRIIDALLDCAKRGDALPKLEDTLSVGDDAVIDAIRSRFTTFSPPQQVMLLTVCGAIGTESARLFLHDLSTEYMDGRAEIEDARLAGLAQSGYTQDDITVLIETQHRHGKTLVAYAREIETDKFDDTITDTLVVRAINEDYQRIQARMLNILKFAYPAPLIDSIAYALHTGDQEMRANALELLEVSLHHDIKRPVMDIIEGTSLAERVETLKIPSDYRAWSTVTHGPMPLSVWTHACLDYAEHQHNGTEQNHPMYSIIEKIILLRSVSIFAETPDSVLAEVAQVVREETAHAGDTLMQKGDFGNSMYLIISGRVSVVDGDAVIQTLGEREIVGEMAVLDPAPRSATVKADTETRYFVLDADMLNALMLTHPQITRAIIKVLVRRIRGVLVN